jgi:hypothetical protein
MTILIDVHNIVADYLVNNGFSGLYSPGKCACANSNLASCGEIKHDCVAVKIEEIIKVNDMNT